MNRFDQAIPFEPAGAGGAAREDEGSAAVRDPDTRLMLEFQQGRVDAFEQLVLRNQSKVHSVIYRFLGDRSACEDLAQDVFLRVFRSADRYVPSAKFSTWLYRIAANVALNAMRSLGRGRPVSLEIESSSDGQAFQRDIPDTRYAEPHAGLERAELAGQVGDAIAQLPDKQRIAIILNKYEGLCYEEIAAVLDCSTMAVKSLLSRARTNLKDRLVRYLSGGPARAGAITNDDAESAGAKEITCRNPSSERNLSRRAGFAHRKHRSRPPDPAEAS